MHNPDSQARNRPEAPKSLYVHVPFCLKRCDYCDFASSVYDHSAASRYVDALERELDSVAAGALFETIYVGGGTPTALDGDIIERLLAALGPRLGAGGASGCEYTVEANPGTVDAARALLLKARGVNRVSLGVQSFSDERLRMLGRIHTAEDCRRAFSTLRERGFENVSLDLMIGLPETEGTSGAEAAAESAVESAVGLSPEHLSVYILSVEPGTPLHRRIEAGELRAASDERAAREYRRARERLAAAGYVHYEISNFARPGRASRHNTACWTGGEYLGVGASAASFVAGVRRTNVRDHREYARRADAGENLVASMERLGPERAAREALVLGLRMLRGVDAGEFRLRTGFSPRELAGREIDAAVARGLLEEEGGVLRLSSEGVVVADSVMAELV